MVRREKKIEEKGEKERERTILSSFSFSHPLKFVATMRKFSSQRRSFRSSLHHGSFWIASTGKTEIPYRGAIFHQTSAITEH